MRAEQEERLTKAEGRENRSEYFYHSTKTPEEGHMENFLPTNLGAVF